MKLWKGKKASRVVAWLLASAMVLSGFTAMPVSAEEPETVSDGDIMVVGNELGGASPVDGGIMPLSDSNGSATSLDLSSASDETYNEYKEISTGFTLLANSSKGVAIKKISTVSSSYTVPAGAGFTTDSFCVRATGGGLAVNGGKVVNGVKFTTSTANAEITVWAAAKAGKSGNLIIKKSTTDDDSALEDNNAYTSASGMSDTSFTKYETTLGEAGTYYIGADSNGCVIAVITIVETPTATVKTTSLDLSSASDETYNEYKEISTGFTLLANSSKGVAIKKISTVSSSYTVPADAGFTTDSFCVRATGGGLAVNGGKVVNGVKFTTSTANAEITVWAAAKAGKSGNLIIKKSTTDDDSALEDNNAYTSASGMSDTSFTKYETTLGEAGTYYIGASSNGCVIASIVVTETTGGVEKVKVTPTITGLPSGYSVKAGDTALTSGTEVSLESKSLELTVVKSDGTVDKDYRATVDGNTKFNPGKVEGGTFTVTVSSAFINPTVKLSGVALAGGNKVTVKNTTTTTDADQTVTADGDTLRLRIDDTYEVSTESGTDTKALVGSKASFVAKADMTELEISIKPTALTPEVIIDETELSLGAKTLTLTANGAASGVDYSAANGFGKLNVGTEYTLTCSDSNIIVEIKGSSKFTMTEDDTKIVVVLSTKQEGLYVYGENELKPGLVTGQEYPGGVSVLQNMPYKDGGVAGTDNPKDGEPNASGGATGTNVKGTIPKSGAVVVIKAQKDGRFKVTTKNNGKVLDFVDDATGTGTSATQPSASGRGTNTFRMEAGHTYYFYAEVSKAVIYGMTVDYTDPIDWDRIMTPVLSTPVVNSAEGTITVPFEAQVGGRYADSVDVRMIKDGELIETISYTDDLNKYETGSVTFTPPASGVYEFQALATRAGEVSKVSETVKAENFVLPMATPVIVGVENQGSGEMRFSWNEVNEASSYEVYLDGELKGTTDKAVYHFSGLEVNKKYTFGVIAIGNGTRSKMATVEQTVSADAKKTWQFTRYGSSVSTKDSENGYSVGSDTANPLEGLSVWSLGGKGKLVPASTDGIAFYYTTIDPTTENFTLSADITVDKWKYSNGQEGFGIMAADTVGADGDSSAVWNNSYMATVTKTEYLWNHDTQVVGDSGTKYSMYLGVGAQEKIGVTPDNIDGMADGSMVSEFSSTMYPLETKAALQDQERLGGGYNIVGNRENANDKATDIAELTTFHLSIQRNNTGYILSYTDENGVTTSKKYYHGDNGDELTKLDPNNIYLGFYASRNAKITVNNVSLTTINPANDAPAEERPVTYVTPKVTIESSKYANSSDYDLVFYTNFDGIASVDCTSGIITDSMEVKAETKYHIATKVYPGFTEFGITVTPDSNFVPSKYERLTDYNPVSASIKVDYSTSRRNIIYVSPDGGGYGAEGSKEDPASIYYATTIAKPGDQILLMEGTYNLSETVVVDRGIDGTADQKIYMIADPEAKSRPVLDFGKACAGMVLAGDYWYYQGFDVTNSADGQKGIQVSGNNNVLDNIMTYRNGNTGIQISRYKGADLWEDWPANNLILNCTSFLNADSGYEDADGFAAKLTIADGNVFDGCIAAFNADDGWDCFAKVESGPIGKVTIKNSLAFKNGYILDGSGNQINAGNGNGFKMGGDSLTGHHTLINSIAFANKAKGIDSNSCPDIQVYNSTSYDNGSYNVAFYTNNAKNTDFLADGIVSYKTSNEVAEQLKFKGMQDTGKVYVDSNYFFNGTKSVNTKKVEVTSDWFVNLDTDAAIKGFMAYVNGQNGSGICRNADNTINMNGYLVLTSAAPADSGARIEGAGTSSSVVEVQKLETITEDDEDDDRTIVEIGNEGRQESVDRNSKGEELITLTNANFPGTSIKGTSKVLSKGWFFTMENITGGYNYELASKAVGKHLKGCETFKVMEINLFDSSSTQIHQLDGVVTVKVPMPEGLKIKAGRQLVVYRLNDDGTLTKCQTSLSGGNIVFYSDHFSTFIFASQTNDGAKSFSGSSVKAPATGDNIPMTGALMMLILAMVIMAVFGRKYLVKKFH